MPVARRVVRITSVRDLRTVAESFAYDTDGGPWELEQAAHDAAIRGATRLVGQRIDTFRQDMVNLHARIVQELKRRGLPHFERGDDLDKDTKPFLKQYAEVRPSGDKLGEPITID